jgi:hypothetical protein
MALHRISDREEIRRRNRRLNARGWEVRTRVDDEDVGKVKDVLVEDTGEARYLDVDLGIFQQARARPGRAGDHRLGRRGRLGRRVRQGRFRARSPSTTAMSPS